MVVIDESILKNKIRICPFCNKNMILSCKTSFSWHDKCINGCLRVSRIGVHVYRVQVFDRVTSFLSFPSNENHKIKTEIFCKEVQDNIEYYKENDRYLMKLLEG